MRLLFLSLILLLSFQFSYSQTGKIKYIFPDSVEIKAEKYIQEYLKHEPQASFYLTLYRGMDTFHGRNYEVYTLGINKRYKSSNLISEKWIENSTRYGLINTTLYPILLDSDYTFSTSKENNLGEFGKRDEEIARIIPLSHYTYTITFHKNGKIFRESKY